MISGLQEGISNLFRSPLQAYSMNIIWGNPKSRETQGLKMDLTCCGIAGAPWESFCSIQSFQTRMQ